MNLKKIEKLLSIQKIPATKKSNNETIQTVKVLEKFNVTKDSEFYEIYSKYFLRWIGSPNLSRICDPLDDNFLSAQMAHNYWNIPKNYILFTTGEGEGGYLYNTEDDTVWDFNLGQQQELLNGTLPHWDSFYEFMEWYLTIEEED